MSGFKMIFLEKLLVFFNYILRANTSTGVSLQDFLEEVMGFLTITFIGRPETSAGGTGPLWIPVPTKLFHNGGSKTWPVLCTCRSSLVLKLLIKLLYFVVSRNEWNMFFHNFGA